MSYEIIKSDKALIPTEQVGSVYILYSLYNSDTKHHFTGVTIYVNRKLKYFLTQTEQVAKKSNIHFFEFNEMIKFLSESPAISDKYKAKVKILSFKHSLRVTPLKFLIARFKTLQKKKLKKELSSKELLKYFEIEKAISQHSNLLVSKISFTAQLISLLEQKHPNENPIQIYVNFLKEYTQRQGEDLEEYITMWARRLIIDNKIATAEELDKAHQETKDKMKVYNKIHYNKNCMDCGKKITYKSTRCQRCSQKKRRNR